MRNGGVCRILFEATIEDANRRLRSTRPSTRRCKSVSSTHDAGSRGLAQPCGVAALTAFGTFWPSVLTGENSMGFTTFGLPATVESVASMALYGLSFSLYDGICGTIREFSSLCPSM